MYAGPRDAKRTRLRSRNGEGGPAGGPPLGVRASGAGRLPTTINGGADHYAAYRSLSSFRQMGTPCDTCDPPVHLLSSAPCSWPGRLWPVPALTRSRPWHPNRLRVCIPSTPSTAASACASPHLGWAIAPRPRRGPASPGPSRRSGRSDGAAGHDHAVGRRARVGQVSHPGHQLLPGPTGTMRWTIPPCAPTTDHSR